MPSKTAKTARPVISPSVVMFIVYPHVKLLDLAGPLQAFSDALNDTGQVAYRTVVAAIDGHSVPSDTPVPIATEALSAWTRRRIDTLIVVGGKGVFAAAEDQRLLAYVKQFASRVRRVGSICNGAFILAACGLLDGRSAVTHWQSCRKLAEAYPDVRVEEERIFVEDDKYWTSAGVTAGIDMAIAMITEDLGRSAAVSLARSLVTYHIRPGGQAQFSEALSLQSEDGTGRFDKLHNWMLRNLQEDLPVARLAEHARMSPRNFSRLYHAQTGRTPAKAVEAIRVEAARMMLEEGNGSLSVIARRCGFGDDERMRRSFVRLLNIPPGEYRNRFGG